MAGPPALTAYTRVEPAGILPELEELEDELLDDEELLEEDELLDEEVLLLDVLLEEDELLEELPTVPPDEVLPPPHPTRRTHAASAPPVKLSILLIAYILFSTSGCWFLIEIILNLRR